MRGAPRLARATGAAKPYYNPRAAARKMHAAGLYLIGRVVTFQDPVVSESGPGSRSTTRTAPLWHTNGGLGWLNPTTAASGTYDVAIATAAVRAGFDEIQFDYVRFPSDGDVSGDPLPGAHERVEGEDDHAVRASYASRKLHALHARVSVDVFGLAATRDLGIGQKPQPPRAVRRRRLPDGLPVAFQPGRVRPRRPERQPGPDRDRRAPLLRDGLRGSGARLVPWLQDFSLGRTYTAADLQGAGRRGALDRTRAASCSGTRSASIPPAPSRAHRRAAAPMLPIA